MHVRRAIAGAIVTAAAALAACKDVPFAPKWDADWYMPLSTKTIKFAFPIIPGNTSVNVSFKPLTQQLNSTIGDILKKVVTDPARSRSLLTMTITKTQPFTGNDTLVIAPDSAGLTSLPAGTILFPIVIPAANDSLTDSIAVSQTSIQMLQNLATAKQPLWIQMRGTAANPSASTIILTNADSIGVRLAMTVRVALSSR